MVQVVEETADLDPFEKTGGSDCHSCCGCDSSFLLRSARFSNREERENMNRCGHWWSLGSRDRNEEICNETKRHMQTLEFPAK